MEYTRVSNALAATGPWSVGNWRPSTTKSLWGRNEARSWGH